jgi:DNA polymerase I
LLEKTFNVLIAPVEMLADALNSNLNLQRHKILFISGNYSRNLTRLDRRLTSLEVRRAFTCFQLMTILEENHHSFLIVEHDPMLYEDAKQMVEYVGQALKQTSREATILLCAPALDPHLQKMIELANLGVLHLRRRESTGERAGEDARRPGHLGGVLMRWPWIRDARPIEPRPVINPKVLELQTT